MKRIYLFCVEINKNADKGKRAPRDSGIPAVGCSGDGAVPAIWEILIRG